MSRTRWPVAALSVGGWLLLSLFTATQWQLINVTYGLNRPWLEYLRPALIANVLWAGFTPGVVWLAKRIRLEPGRGTVFFLTHLVTGSLVSIAHTLLYVVCLGFLLGGDEDLGFGSHLLVRKLAGSFQANLLIYAIITAFVVGRAALTAARQREVEKVSLEARLAQTEIAILKSQLQPHFVFNALNTISALVRTAPIEAERTIAALGDLLRMAMARPAGNTSTLGEDILLAEAYLTIEQARFGDRMDVVRDIGEGALSATVPSLLLQPLIENAIKHGITPSPHHSRLSIAAHLDGDMLRVEVSDDGVGADSFAERIGIGNLRERLKRLYGDRHALEIDTRPGAGFRITIRIPQ